jgi:hypothetical protein
MAALTLLYVVVGFAGDQFAPAVASLLTIVLSLLFLAEFLVRIWASTSRVGYLRRVTSRELV